jgi:hypothetical protein
LFEVGQVADVDGAIVDPPRLKKAGQGLDEPLGGRSGFDGAAQTGLDALANLVVRFAGVATDVRTIGVRAAPKRSVAMCRITRALRSQEASGSGRLDRW